MDSPLLLGALAVGAALVGVFAGWWLERSRLKRHRADAESVAARIREEAGAEAERLKREAELEGREEAYRAREEWEREEARRREDLERAERDRGASQCARPEVRPLDANERGWRKECCYFYAELQARDEATARLEQEARARRRSRHGTRSGKRLTNGGGGPRLRSEHDPRDQGEREADAEREARNIVALVIQRIAADHTAESTVSVVSLPSDEMQGDHRREGRTSARSQATGIDDH